MLHYDIYWLSRAIHTFTGSTYTALLQQKRMRQAAYLLETSGAYGGGYRGGRGLRKY